MTARALQTPTHETPALTPQALLEKWESRRAQYAYEGSLVVAERVVAEMLADLRATLESEQNGLVSLLEASRLTGYHPDTLGRRVKRGELQNYGRRHAPKVRVGDLTPKPGYTSAAPLNDRAPSDKVAGDHPAVSLAGVDVLAHFRGRKPHGRSRGRRARAAA
jgi:hypothetical protein